MYAGPKEGVPDDRIFAIDQRGARDDCNGRFSVGEGARRLVVESEYRACGG